MSRSVFAPPKSEASGRTMCMPDVVGAMGAIHLEREGLGEDNTDALVFTDGKGGALRYSNWRRRICEPATTAAGCAAAGFHDLRRLNATTLVVEGVDVKTAQTRLGDQFFGSDDNGWLAGS
jgi:site-specific recombinase XerD